MSETPKLAGVEELISLKLDSWRSTQLARLRDKSDVVELILRRKLPRDLKVDPAVVDLYREVWDGLEKERQVQNPD